MPVFSSIAGGLAAGAAGSLLGGGSGGGGSVATQGAYTPDFNVNSGLFQTGLRKTGQETNTVDGVKSRTFSGADIDLGMSPELQALSQMGIDGSGMFLDRAQGQGGIAGQAEGLSQDFLSQLGVTDPMQVAQNQFDLLNPILQDQQNQDFLGQESRLFAQGRLGGAGQLSGQAQQNALFDAQNDAERKLLFDSLNQGLATQQHQFNLGSGLAGLGQSQRTSDFNLGSGFLNIPLSLQQALLNQATTSANLAGTRQVGQTSGVGGLNPIQTVGAGLLNTGVNSVSQGIGNIFSGFGQGPGSNNINGWTNTVGR